MSFLAKERKTSAPAAWAVASLILPLLCSPLALGEGGREGRAAGRKERGLSGSIAKACVLGYMLLWAREARERARDGGREGGGRGRGWMDGSRFELRASKFGRRRARPEIAYDGISVGLNGSSPIPPCINFARKVSDQLNRHLVGITRI